MTHTIETLKELHDERFVALDERFVAVDKALVLAANEIDRRLEVLNHSHEILREKERTFVNREAFEMFRQRVADDIAILRNETQSAVATASAVREIAVKAVADGITDQNTKNEIRFGKVESVFARLIGGLAFGAVILPLITGMLVYLLARSQ